MKEINTKEAFNIHENEPETLFINVLPKDSFENGHIPGSINIPFDDKNFLDRVKERVPDMNQPIAVYCQNEECKLSDNAAKKLEEAGYKKVMHFGEGIEGWESGNQKVETGP